MTILPIKLELPLISSFFNDIEDEYDIIFFPKKDEKNKVFISVKKDTDNGRIITFAVNLIEKYFDTYGKLIRAYHISGDLFSFVFENQKGIDSSDKELIWCLNKISQEAEKENNIKEGVYST